jgi:hypothetical protein
MLLNLIPSVVALPKCSRRHEVFHNYKNHHFAPFKNFIIK